LKCCILNKKTNPSLIQNFQKFPTTIPNIGKISKITSKQDLEKVSTLFLPLILKIGKEPDKNNSGIFELIWQRLVDGGDLLLDIFVRPTSDYYLAFSEEQWRACLLLLIPIYFITIFLCIYFRILNKYQIKLFLMTEFIFHYTLALSHHYFFEALNFSYQGKFLLSQPLILAPMMFLIQVLFYYFFIYEKNEK